MVTHDQEEALSVADRIVVMNHGVIEQVGTPMEIYRDPATPFVADFVGKINVLSGRLHPGRDLRIGTSRFACEHDTAAERDVKVYLRPEDVLARPIAPGRRQRLRRRDRQDRVPRLVLPGARQRRGDGRAADHRLPLAQLPRRAGARGRQPAAAEAAARADALLLARRRRTGRVRRPHRPADARAAPARALERPRRARGAARLVALALVAFLALPLATILAKALQDRDGAFVGLANFASYLGTPALLQSFVNSVWVAALVTVVTVPLAFGFAYALARSCIPAKGMFRTIALIPLLAPTLLSAISLIYWFGNQGIAKGLVTRPRLREHLRRAGHRRRRVLRRLSARADDPAQRARARRRAPLRSGRRARHVDAAQVLHHHAAGREVRPDLGGAGRLHAGDDRLRHPEGDRRQLQHARHRRLQARHRPAGLPARRRRRPAAADAGGAHLRHRLAGAAEADRDAHARAPCRSSAAALARLRRADARLCRARSAR